MLQHSEAMSLQWASKLCWFGLALGAHSELRGLCSGQQEQDSVLLWKEYGSFNSAEARWRLQLALNLLSISPRSKRQNWVCYTASIFGCCPFNICDTKSAWSIPKPQWSMATKFKLVDTVRSVSREIDTWLPLQFCKPGTQTVLSELTSVLPWSIQTLILFLELLE